MTSQSRTLPMPDWWVTVVIESEASRVLKTLNPAYCR
jgi:hypothetical protein